MSTADAMPPAKRAEVRAPPVQGPKAPLHYNPPPDATVPPVLKRSMLAPHGPKLAPKWEQEDEWAEFCERTDGTRIHDFGNYWWNSGRDEDDDGFLREAVFLEVPLRKGVEAKQIRVTLNTRGVAISANGETILDEQFQDTQWLNVDESYWEIQVKEVKKVRRKVLRYTLYILMECPKYITQYLFESEKKEDDGRWIDQNEDEEDTIDDRLRVIAKMKEPEPYRDADIWFSDTESEEERWCEGCGSTRVVIMKKPTDPTYMKYCNDCPYVSKAKDVGLPTGLERQRDLDGKRTRKKRLKSRKETAKKRLADEQAKADEGNTDREEEVPADYNKSEKTRVYTDKEFCEEVEKMLRRGDIKWEDY